jgi:hypothetical protein
MTPRPPHAVSISEIVAGLNARIDQLVAQLLPGGRREGAEWVCGSLAGEPGRSCKVHLRSPREGVWSDFATGERGDALDLVAAVQFRNDKTAAIKWAKAWLGYTNEDPARMAIARRQAAEKARASEASADQEFARKRASAQRLWLSAQDTIKGTLAELYLHGRGVDFGRIGRYPRALRFARALDAWQPQAGSDKWVKAGTFPCLLAAIVDEKGQHVATHRTWLQPNVDDDGVVTVGKAPLDDAKMTLGRYVGGCIRLFKPLLRDAEGKPRRGPSLADAPADAGVTLTEGIEDGLSVAMADQSEYILVAVSLSNMAALWLPPQIARVRIVAQNDTKKAAIDALDRAIAFHIKHGRQVRIARPPAGVKDVNDLLQLGGAA